MNFKEFETPKKLRGGYYTPHDLATFLVRWIEKSSPSRVLEPSCGDGVFLDALGSRNFPNSVLGLELDEVEAKKAKDRAASVGLSDVNIQTSDFLGWALKAMESKPERFDAVIGKPILRSSSSAKVIVAEHIAAC